MMLHQSLMQMLAPRYCLICETQLVQDPENVPAGVCDTCRPQLPMTMTMTPETVFQTALQPASAARDSTDGHVRVTAPSIDEPEFFNTVCAFSYEQPVQALIKDYKFRARLDIGAGLADELARRIRYHPIPDALVPVPLHPRRLRQRGFNQATEIARRLSEKHEIPILINKISRIQWSTPQTGLSASERLLNVTRAFTVNRPVPAHIAIIDDVVTSGATSAALMRALYEAGGRRFQLWVLARAFIR